MFLYNARVRTWKTPENQILERIIVLGIYRMITESTVCSTCKNIYWFHKYLLKLNM